MVLLIFLCVLMIVTVASFVLSIMTGMLCSSQSERAAGPHYDFEVMGLLMMSHGFVDDVSVSC